MRILFVLIAFLFCSLQAFAQTQQFRAVPFTNVKLNDRFWSQRLKINREISIPHNYDWCEKTGRFSNFAKAAKIMDGKFEGIYFNDSDVYKLLEGTAYSLADHPDPELEKRANQVIDWIKKAQLPSGYLNTYFQLAEPDKKWTDITKHELYCAGHLFEAAAAMSWATGNDELLYVAENFAEHIMDVFGPDKKTKFEVPGHEEIELALVKLFQSHISKDKYMELAEQFINTRGDQSKRSDKIHGEYDQDHLPIREQSEIVGHAVRAVYLYAGVADIAAYNKDAGLIAAMDRLWDDVVNKKMYITGGIGARHAGEAFGDAYELPNRTAYCETCAAIGLTFWAHRMNLLHGDAKYADVVERAMYNGILSGIGLDGKHFFYVNPLESTGNHHRQPFFDCACCPTNVVRFVPSLPGYQYAVQGNTVYINQYASGTATIDLGGGDDKVTITQETNYPWDGKVKCTITNQLPENSYRGVNPSKNFTVVMREPRWFSMNRNEYVGSVTTEWNAQGIKASEGSVTVIEKDFKMEPKRIIANPKVVADNGRVAIQRGPLVYCFEQCDNTVPIRQIKLARNPEFTEEFKDIGLPGGQKVMVIKCKNADGQELVAVPYFAWDHREAGAMAVWVRQEGLSKKQPPETGDKLYAELKPEMLSASDDLAGN